MSHSSHENPCIVFTKPEHQAQTLQSKIHIHTQNIPLFEIEWLGDQDSARETLLDLAEFTHIVVTSPNAAAALLELMDQYWPMLPEDPKWFCPGAGTAKVLSSDYQYPIQPIYSQAGSSSEHILALDAFDVDELSKVLVVKGEGGRSLIQQQAQEKGASVSELNLYRRNALPLENSQKQTLQAADLLVVSSLEVLQALQRQLGADFLASANNQLLVTSERLLESARSGLASTIIQSTVQPIIHIQKADNESIAQAVNQWVKDLKL